MGINFKKIFARKAKEIADQVDEGEKLLNDAQNKLCKLKCSSKAEILKNEINDIFKEIIENERYHSKYGYYRYHCNDIEKNERVNQSLRSCLNELCELAERGER